MPEVTVNVEVYCAKCGAGLCNQTQSVSTHHRGEPSFRVMPCEHCMEKEYDKGYDAGRDVGYAEGYREAEELRS